MKTVTITSGGAIIYRLFDIADEIDLARIGAASSRVSIARGGAQVVVRDAPVSIALGATAIRLGSRLIEADTYARAWNYGAVSLQFHINITRMTWDELVELAALAEDDNDVDAVAATRLIEVQTSCAPALILGEPRTKLAAQTRQTIAAYTFSYSEEDLAVVDWNSALVFDSRGANEVADVLEFALTRLMEFRSFDDILDQRLEHLFAEVERRRPSLFYRGFESLSREANALYLEFADYVERVENTSELLQGEVNVRRSHFLEIIIIVLILYEIVAAAT